jgi:hypothetical protein
MSENSLSRHGADALKKFETTSNSSEFTKDNIWFDWGDKEEHVIRIVGDFRISRTHWIGESKFGNDVAILKSSAFKGENKLPMTVACGNWDADTETEDPDGNGCPICRLGKNADAMLKKYGKSLVEDQKENLKNIRRKCQAKSQYLFKIIDRDNPYVDDEKTRKGYKILRAPEKLLKAILALSDSMEGIAITSPDEGIDIKIKKTVSATTKTDVTYSALAVMAGPKVKQTPLTDEELAYRDLDLLKFVGKPVDTKRFEEEMEGGTILTVYANSDMNTDGEEEGGNAPF